MFIFYKNFYFIFLYQIKMFKRPSEKIYFLKKKGTDINLGEMEVPDTEIAKTPGLFAPNVGLVPSDMKSRQIKRPVRAAAPMKSLDQRLYEEELKRKAQAQISSAQPAFPSADQGPQLGPATELDALMEAARQLNPSDRAVAFEQLKNLREGTPAQETGSASASASASASDISPPSYKKSLDADIDEILGSNVSEAKKKTEVRKILATSGLSYFDANAMLRNKGLEGIKTEAKFDELVARYSASQAVTGKGLVFRKKGKKKMMSEDVEGGAFGLGDLVSFGKKAYEEGEKLYKIGKKVYDVAKPIIESDAGKKGISMVSKKLFGGELEDAMLKAPVRPFWMNMKNPMPNDKSPVGTVSAKIDALKAEIPVEKPKTSQHKMLVF